MAITSNLTTLNLEAESSKVTNTNLEEAAEGAQLDEEELQHMQDKKYLD